MTDMNGVQLCASPIFVIGAPRSGTTAVGLALAWHSNLWTAGESQVLTDLFGEDNIYANYNRSEAAEGSWLKKHGVMPPELCTFLGIGVNALFTSVADGKRWIDHTPGHTLMVEILKEMFPEAVFVHVLRDGRRVVHSMVNFLLKETSESRAHLRDGYVNSWMTDFSEACRTWRSHVNKAMDFCEQHPERCVTVVNEELIADPVAGFRTIFEFIGEPNEEQSAHYFGSNRVNSSFEKDSDKPAAVRRILQSDPWQGWTLEQRVTFLEEAGQALVRYGLATEEELQLA
jgi:hypothetical protein